MRQDEAPKDETVTVEDKPRMASAAAILKILTRCSDFESRLETEPTRKKNVGRNQNVLAANFLRKAYDAFLDLEHECWISGVKAEGHCPTGRSSSARAA